MVYIYLINNNERIERWEAFASNEARTEEQNENAICFILRFSLSLARSYPLSISNRCKQISPKLTVTNDLFRESLYRYAFLRFPRRVARKTNPSKDKSTKSDRISHPKTWKSSWSLIARLRIQSHSQPNFTIVLSQIGTLRRSTKLRVAPVCNFRLISWRVFETRFIPSNQISPVYHQWLRVRVRVLPFEQFHRVAGPEDMRCYDEIGRRLLIASGVPVSSELCEYLAASSVTRAWVRRDGTSLMTVAAHT